MMSIQDEPRDFAPSHQVDRSAGQASARHQGLHRPNDDQRVGQALDDVGLDDQGEVLEDELRDRRSRGAPPANDVRSDDAGEEGG